MFAVETVGMVSSTKLHQSKKRKTDKLYFNVCRKYTIIGVVSYGLGCGSEFGGRKKKSNKYYEKIFLKGNLCQRYREE